MVWCLPFAVVAAYMVYSGRQTLKHPATVLVREGSRRGWVACGRRKDAEARYNVHLERGGVRVEVTYQRANLHAIRLQHGEPFLNFEELERWLATPTTIKALNVSGPQGTVNTLPEANGDVANADDAELEFRTETEHFIKGHGDDWYGRLLAL